MARGLCPTVVSAVRSLSWSTLDDTCDTLRVNFPSILPSSDLLLALVIELASRAVVSPPDALCVTRMCGELKRMEQPDQGRFRNTLLQQCQATFGTIEEPCWTVASAAGLGSLFGGLQGEGVMQRKIVHSCMVKALFGQPVSKDHTPAPPAVIFAAALYRAVEALPKFESAAYEKIRRRIDDLLAKPWKDDAARQAVVQTWAAAPSTVYAKHATPSSHVSSPQQVVPPSPASQATSVSQGYRHNPYATDVGSPLPTQHASPQHGPPPQANQSVQSLNQSITSLPGSPVSTHSHPVLASPTNNAGYNFPTGPAGQPMPSSHMPYGPPQHQQPLQPVQPLPPNTAPMNASYPQSYNQQPVPVTQSTLANWNAQSHSPVMPMPPQAHGQPQQQQQHYGYLPDPQHNQHPPAPPRSGYHGPGQHAPINMADMYYEAAVYNSYANAEKAMVEHGICLQKPPPQPHQQPTQPTGPYQQQQPVHHQHVPQGGPRAVPPMVSTTSGSASPGNAGQLISSMSLTDADSSGNMSPLAASSRASPAVLAGTPKRSHARTPPPPSVSPPPMSPPAGSPPPGSPHSATASPSRGSSRLPVPEPPTSAPSPPPEEPLRRRSGDAEAAVPQTDIFIACRTKAERRRLGNLLINKALQEGYNRSYGAARRKLAKFCRRNYIGEADQAVLVDYLNDLFLAGHTYRGLCLKEFVTVPQEMQKELAHKRPSPCPMRSVRKGQRMEADEIDSVVSGHSAWGTETWGEQMSDCELEELSGHWGGYTSSHGRLSSIADSVTSEVADLASLNTPPGEGLESIPGKSDRDPTGELGLSVNSLASSKRSVSNLSRSSRASSKSGMKYGRIPEDVTIDDRVKVLRTDGTENCGTVKYIGFPKFTQRGDKFDGCWIGVCLDEAVGTHDGSIDGQRYFYAGEKRGVFVREDKIIRQPDGIEGPVFFYPQHLTNRVLRFDVRPEVFRPYGFKHGDRISAVRTTKGTGVAAAQEQRIGTVVGVRHGLLFWRIDGAKVTGACACRNTKDEILQVFKRKKYQKVGTETLHNHLDELKKSIKVPPEAAADETSKHIPKEALAKVAHLVNPGGESWEGSLVSPTPAEGYKSWLKKLWRTKKISQATARQ